MIIMYRDIRVRVLGTRDAERGVRAYVQAVSGEPFCQMTHGGPVQSDTAWLPYDCLTFLPCPHDHTVLDVRGHLDWWPDGCPDDNRVERLLCLDCGQYVEESEDENDRVPAVAIDF